MGSATWRLAANHRVGLQVFQTKRSAEKTIERTLEFKDQVILAGTTLSTESKTSFYIANYQYSFIKNDNMELAGVFGIYTANFRFKFNSGSPPVEDATTGSPEADRPQLRLLRDTAVDGIRARRGVQGQDR